MHMLHFRQHGACTLVHHARTHGVCARTHAEPCVAAEIAHVQNTHSPVASWQVQSNTHRAYGNTKTHACVIQDWRYHDEMFAM